MNSPEIFKADLHTHSTHSDGTFTPKELIDLSLQKELNALSITDHDTTNAFDEIQLYASKKKIKLITGVEFSCSQGGKPIHILGYAFKSKDPSIKKLENTHIKRRLLRNTLIIKRLQEMGFKIEYDEILASIPHPRPSQIGRPHIAQFMKKKGFVSSFQEAFKKYLGDGKSAYVFVASPTVAETIEAIHEAKGIAVIAHPHLINHESTFQKLLSLPFDGIECIYGTFSKFQNEKFIQIANKKNWLITGGSDFHGTIRPQSPLGIARTPLETFKILEDIHRQNNQ